MALSANPPRNPVPEWSGAKIPIRYLQTDNILVRGPSTGKHYQFTSSAPVQMVDDADVGPLVSSGYFRVNDNAERA